MTTDAKPLMPQTIGDYQVLGKIAEGGMGAVYKGKNWKDGMIVAIKVLPSTTAKNATLLKRFEQEFKAASQLDHPNIVRAIEYNGAGASPFLVMEFVDGESLGNRIDREGPMGEEQAIRIIAQVCQGLHRAHKQNMIHRDVKPDNIMMTRDGVAKLTDLGLVKDAESDTNLTKTGRGLGTPNFMAPEQFRNAKNADIRCDIYSLGATLYTMLTGEVPFGKIGPLDCWMKKIRNDLTPPRELNPAVSERVDWAIRRSMSGDPDKRPTSCKEFVEDLTGVSIKPSGEADGSGSQDLWYLVYKDDEGETHTVKGTTESIRRAMKDGLLGDASNIRASRTKTGQFAGLHAHPEFRDLVIAPAPMEIKKTSSDSQRVTPSPHARETIAKKGRTDPDAVEYGNRAVSDPYAPTVDYQATNGEPRPHIPMGRIAPKSESKSNDSVLWAVILALALGTAVAAVLLLKKFV
jgi:eukaryotic-like serine/threonine-protein kinase